MTPCEADQFLTSVLFLPLSATVLSSLPCLPVLPCWMFVCYPTIWPSLPGLWILPASPCQHAAGELPPPMASVGSASNSLGFWH